uniref:Cysteine proteinase inhibitor n=1 Tax=Kalanchoe fedtschenkoi TaxID=63787 RepID=A0A7N1A6S8_KALFE
MAIAVGKLSIVVILAALVICGFGELGVCIRDVGSIRMATRRGPVLGGISDLKGGENSVEIESLARFAVQEHNKNQNSLLTFGRVVKAKQQVVAGMMYYLTLEAMDTGKKKLYEAKVWVKPWMNFKQLQEFKHACEGRGSSVTSSDLVRKQGH